MNYKPFKIRMTKDQQKKAMKGQGVRLTKDQLGSGEQVMLHTENFKKVSAAHRNGTGVLIYMSPGEIMASAQEAGLMPQEIELSGSGFFQDVWDGLKKVGGFLKDTGAGSLLADAAAAAAVPFVGTTGSQLGRKVFKGLTGVGAGGKRRGRKPIDRALDGSGLYL